VLHCVAWNSAGLATTTFSGESRAAVTAATAAAG
jgi:hypothetical protein